VILKALRAIESPDLPRHYLCRWLGVGLFNRLERDAIEFEQAVTTCPVRWMPLPEPPAALEQENDDE
jgi:hypothetical protein